MHNDEAEAHAAERDLVTMAQAAQRLRVTRWTVSRWAEAGRLKIAFRGAGRNGQVLFEAAEVERMRAKLEQARTQVGL